MRRIAALSWILSALFLTGCMTTGQGTDQNLDAADGLVGYGIERADEDRGDGGGQQQVVHHQRAFAAEPGTRSSRLQRRGAPGEMPERAADPMTASQSPNTPQALPVSNAAAPEAGWQAVASPTVASPASADYQLGPLDIIEVSVFEVPELTKTLQVSSGGEISLPLIGRVVVDGKTVSIVEREIELKLAKDYLQSPQVSVFVKEYTSQRISIEGEVNGPGVFPIAGRTTLLQAIAMAKGTTRVADDSGIIIFRTTGGTRTAAVFDIGPIRKGDAPDPLLVAGDLIVVDQSGPLTAWRTLRESLGVMSFFRPF